jgi:hypothetical protein
MVMHKREVTATAASLKFLSSVSMNVKPYTAGGTKPKTRNDNKAMVA